MYLHKSLARAQENPLCCGAPERGQVPATHTAGGAELEACRIGIRERGRDKAWGKRLETNL